MANLFFHQDKTEFSGGYIIRLLPCLSVVFFFCWAIKTANDFIKIHSSPSGNFSILSCDQPGIYKIKTGASATKAEGCVTKKKASSIKEIARVNKESAQANKTEGCGNKEGASATKEIARVNKENAQTNKTEGGVTKKGASATKEEVPVNKKGAHATKATAQE
jgi:hypothetical protein